jgi:NAD+ diphosphatase
MSERSGASPGPFNFCPSCGTGGPGSGPAFLEGKRWLCARCGFEYFHNVAAAAGVILDLEGGIVLVERAREPRKGKLGLPGGFVDPGERAEDAALRECREEIGWAPPELAFLGTYPNGYAYGGVDYNTCDLFFYYRLPVGEAMPRLAVSDREATAIKIVPLRDLREEDLAFPSLARALGEYTRLK